MTVVVGGPFHPFHELAAEVLAAARPELAAKAVIIVRSCMFEMYLSIFEGLIELLSDCLLRRANESAQRMIVYPRRTVDSWHLEEARNLDDSES